MLESCLFLVQRSQAIVARVIVAISSLNIQGDLQWKEERLFRDWLGPLKLNPFLPYL